MRTQKGIPRTWAFGGHHPPQGLDFACTSESSGILGLLEWPGIIIVSSFTGGPHGSWGAPIMARTCLHAWSRGSIAESLRVYITSEEAWLGKALEHSGQDC